MPDHEHLGPLPDDQLLDNIKQGCSVCFGELCSTAIVGKSIRSRSEFYVIGLRPRMKLRGHRIRAWKWLVRLIERQPTFLALWARQRRKVFTKGAV